jgi:hypothetical protein
MMPDRLQMVLTIKKLSFKNFIIKSAFIDIPGYIPEPITRQLQVRAKQ